MSCKYVYTRNVYVQSTAWKRETRGGVQEVIFYEEELVFFLYLSCARLKDQHISLQNCIFLHYVCTYTIVESNRFWLNFSRETSSIPILVDLYKLYMFRNTYPVLGIRCTYVSIIMEDNRCSVEFFFSDAENCCISIFHQRRPIFLKISCLTAAERPQRFVGRCPVPYICIMF